jgi:hypothetical protein
MKELKIAWVNQITEILGAEYYVLRSTNIFIPRTATAVRGKYYVLIYKIFDITDYINLHVISLPSTTNRFVSNIPQARLPPYMDGIIGDYSLNSEVLALMLP